MFLCAGSMSDSFLLYQHIIYTKTTIYMFYAMNYAFAPCLKVLFMGELALCLATGECRGLKVSRWL